MFISMITYVDDAMNTLDIETVQAFLLVAELQNFTRAAEVLGTTQAAVSMKLQRLEAMLNKRLVERSPRAVRLPAEGMAFQKAAEALIAAHARALNGSPAARKQLALGFSDHAAGPELVPIMERLRSLSSSLTITVQIGFSHDLLDAFDAGTLAAVIVRPEGSNGGGVTAVVAAAEAGLGAAPLARRSAPPGLIDIGATYKLPKLGKSKVMLYSRVSDAAQLAALRTISAAFRKIVLAA